MEQKNSTSIITVENADVADFLLNYQTQKLIHPFFGAEETVANAAESLDMSISALLYRVQKMQKWGILQVARQEQRAGRAIKIYTSTSDSYFIPFGVTTAVTLANYLEETKRYIQKQFTFNVAEVMRRSREDWGVRVHKDAQGKIHTQFESSPGQPMEIGELNRAVLDFYYPALRLDQADAQALQRELGELFQKYAAKEGTHPYMIHIGLTPILEEI